MKMEESECVKVKKKKASVIIKHQAARSPTPSDQRPLKKKMADVVPNNAPGARTSSSDVNIPLSLTRSASRMTWKVPGYELHDTRVNK